MEDLEEPFDFPAIPLELQCKIVKKFDVYQQFVNFELTSKLAHFVCSSGNYSILYHVPRVYIHKKRTRVSFSYMADPRLERVPWHVANRSPVRIRPYTVYIVDPLSKGRIRKVINIFERNGTKAAEIIIEGRINFEPGDLERLIKITQPHTLTVCQFLRREFLSIPSLRRLTYLNLESTGCTDDEFIKLQPRDFTISSDFITSRGLNTFLKQWKTEEREIDSICIRLGGTLGRRRSEEIFDGLQANPIWTPEFHEDSILGAIPLADIRNMDFENLHCMWRPDDPQYRLFVSIYDTSIDIYTHSELGEAELLLRTLDEDEYYTIRNECYRCQMQFCIHRRKFSVARLKSKFPRVYNCCMFGIKIMSVVSASLRTLTYIAGERSYTRIIADDIRIIQHETGLSKVFSSLHVYLFDYA